MHNHKLKYLNLCAKDAPGTIKYFKADLLSIGSYREAMEGCELVIHTASPCKLRVKDPQKDLVEPALNGTINMLGSVNEVDSVKKVVFTSSISSVHSVITTSTIR